jgi:hypothetical protein
LHPTEIGVVTKAVTFGPGTKEAIICNVSAAVPTQETTKQTPS